VGRNSEIMGSNPATPILCGVKDAEIPSLPRKLFLELYGVRIWHPRSIINNH